MKPLVIIPPDHNVVLLVQRLGVLESEPEVSLGHWGMNARLPVHRGRLCASSVSHQTHKRPQPPSPATEMPFFRYISPRLTSLKKKKKSNGDTMFLVSMRHVYMLIIWYKRNGK